MIIITAYKHLIYFYLTGKVSAWNISKALGLDRFIFPEIFPVLKNPAYVIVILGETRCISRKIYEKAAFNYPMIFTAQEFRKQGKYLLSRISLSEESTGIELASSVRQLGYIDPNTRRSVPIPESSDIFKVPETETRFQVTVEERPSENYKTRRLVQFSDYDISSHVNASSYVQWMIDAASEAAAKGMLASFRENFDHYPEKIETLYRRECFAGDIVDIYLWEESLLCLCFNIEKQGKGELVTFGRIRFYNDLFKSHI